MASYVQQVSKYQPVSAQELSDIVSQVKLDNTNQNEFNFLSDHRPNGADVFFKDIRLCSALTLNVLSPDCFKYNTGFHLNGKPFAEPFAEQCWMKMWNQFGHHESPLAQIDHEIRLQLISDYILLMVSNYHELVFGLQEVDDKQFNLLRKKLPENFTLLRTSFLSKDGKNHFSGVIGFDSNKFTLEKYIEERYQKSGYFIQSVFLKRNDNEQEFFFVNTHVPWKGADILKNSLYYCSNDQNIFVPVIFVGDTNYASKQQIYDDMPMIKKSFENEKFGFAVPKDKEGMPTWTNVNLRQNVMTEDERKWLWEAVDGKDRRKLTEAEVAKRNELENRQCDAFDIIGIVFNDKILSKDISFQNIDMFYNSFKCC